MTPEVLTSSRSLADYFEAAVKAFPQPKMLSNWIMSDLLRELKRENREIEDCPVSPGNLAELLGLLDSGSNQRQNCQVGIRRDVCERQIRAR